MRTPVIAGNWKLFKTIGEATAMVSELKALVAGTTGVEIVVAPVFTALSSVASALAGSNVHVAAQDCYWEEEGAFTGEVSPRLLKDAGCSHVIIGHSERRQYFGETDGTVNKKTRLAIAAGLTAIVCVGETLAEREGDKTFAVIETQITGGLSGLSADSLKQVVIAYEPVWAIGTGKTATPDDANSAHAFIRSEIEKLYGKSVAESLIIQYGGSVKPSNVKDLMAMEHIDGALVGGASLSVEQFAPIVRYNV